MAHSKIIGKLKFLFIGQLPPPVHGVSMMNEYILASEKIRSKFLIDFIRTNTTQSLKNIGGFSFGKLIHALKVFVVTFVKFLYRKPDLVYFTFSPEGFAFYRDIILLKTMFLLGKPKIVLHLHGRGIEQTLYNTKATGAIKTLLNKCFTISLSENVVYDLDLITPIEKFIVYNGIPGTAEQGNKQFNTSQLNILFLSNLVIDKGILFYLECLEKLKLKGMNFQAHIVGEEFDITFGELKNRLVELGVDKNTIVYGPLFGKDKLELIRKCDIFIFPTTIDAFGLVAIEAMQEGLLVFGTKEGSLPIIIKDGDSGFLFDELDASIWAEKIIEVSMDKNIMDKTSHNAKRRVAEEFTIEKFEQKMIDVFDKVLQS